MNSPAADGNPPPGGRRAALLFMSLAAFMSSLDASILNLALPSAQTELTFSDTDRQWVFTINLVAVGLVLLGGRLTDYFGRRTIFLIGIVGLTIASTMAGAANGFGLFLAARAVSGLATAAIIPAAISTIVVLFTDGKERGKAFGVYGAVVGSAGVAALLLGGLVAQVSWRLCFLLNVPLGIVAIIGTVLSVPRDRPGRHHRFDVLGIVLSTLGLVALSYGFTQAVQSGWTATLVMLLLGSAVMLIGGFVWRQARAVDPLLPLRIVRDRMRAGTFAVLFLNSAGMLGLYLFASYHMQVVLGFSPMVAALGLLPATAASQAGAFLAGRFQHRYTPRTLLVPALMSSATAMIWLTQLSVDGSYLWQVLPSELLLGAGVSCVYVTGINTATSAVDPADAGITSAMTTTAGNVGGSLGTAVLSTAAAAATGTYLAASSPTSAQRAEGLVAGFSTAAGWAAALFLVAAVVAAVAITTPIPRRPQPSTPAIEGEHR
ncbi:MFS transporter [Sciscionella marina]|uniref:MFS transporter n=1 Tax=Sciscionella marina TaxID=508770 RepID=UPI00036A579C|nr:MFS transporter [Sciscionella marina]